MLVAKKETYDFYDKQSSEKTNNITRRKKENNVALKVKMFLYALAILTICLTILLRYAYITQIEIEVSHLNKQIDSLNDAKQELVLELDRLNETRWIERQAMAKLDMRYPNNSEKIYVNVDDNVLDKKEAKIANNDGGKDMFLDSFRNIFERIANTI